MIAEVKITEAGIEDKETVRELLAEYLYEMAAYTDLHLEESANVKYPYFDSYWEDEGRIPLIITLAEDIIGFALLNEYTILRHAEATKSIAEFYIRSTYRRYGYGRTAACEIFLLYGKNWEISQLTKNTVSQIFWRKVIHEHTQGNYEEVEVSWRGSTRIVQLFSC